MSVKPCSFAEHSPMLNDITICRSWDQVNQGLMKMYNGEVLGKFAVIQHFIYTPFLSIQQVKQIEELKPEKQELCCSDAIRFPSVLGTKK